MFTLLFGIALGFIGAVVYEAKKPGAIEAIADWAKSKI